jgi:histone deacetylase 8
MSLIRSYGLFDKIQVIKAFKATRQDLEAFHSKDYLDHCDKTMSNDDLEKLDLMTQDGESFGLEYDCPLIPDISTMISWIAGGSLAAAQALNQKEVQVAINWGGGWHHGQRDEASGFCYVNDIVLAVQHLRKVHDKILYIDLDVHHGDGVENAFNFSPKIFTFSLHKYENGYFPGKIPCSVHLLCQYY